MFLFPSFAQELEDLDPARHGIGDIDPVLLVYVNARGQVELSRGEPGLVCCYLRRGSCLQTQTGLCTVNTPPASS